MAVSTQEKQLTDVLQYEDNCEFTREKITVVSGQNLTVGDVVGKITASGKYAIYDNAAADGTEVAAGVLLFSVDASAADQDGVILARGPAIVKDTGLGWNAQAQGAIDAGLADLDTLNIIARTGV